MSEVENDLEQPLVTSPKPKKGRFLGLDLMRGFIMVVMSWDHVKDVMFTHNQSGGENWSGRLVDFDNSLSLLFSRIVSDICAPGFFFTMGMGMTFLYQSRSDKGWSNSKIIWFCIKRGLFMISIERLATIFFSFSQLIGIIEGYNVTSYFRNEPETISNFLIFALFTITVLSVLGISMILTAIFLLYPLIKFKISKKQKFFICVALSSLCYAVSNILIVSYQGNDLNKQSNQFPGILAKPNTIGEVLVRILFFPGTGILSSYNVYPVFPWIGLTVLGIGCGFIAKENPIEFYKNLKYYGMCALVCFVLVRSFGGKFGNLRGWPRGDGKDTHVQFLIEFLYTLKYPPSLAYSLWTMGVNFIVLSLLSEESVSTLMKTEPTAIAEFTKGQQVKYSFYSLLKSLGCSPLFFYVFHLLAINIIAVICSWIFGADNQGRFHITLLLPLVPIWLLVLAIFYPLCNKYSAFKRTTPVDSFWRYM